MPVARVALYEQLRAKPASHELGLGQPLLCRLRGLLRAHVRDGPHTGLANYLMVHYEIIRHDVLIIGAGGAGHLP